MWVLIIWWFTIRTSAATVLSTHPCIFSCLWVSIVCSLVIALYMYIAQCGTSLQWHHNERDGISNHQPNDCLLNRIFRRRSKKASKFHVTDLCAGNSLVTGEFPAQRASNMENVSIWWCHNGYWKVTVKSAWWLLVTWCLFITRTCAVIMMIKAGQRTSGMPNEILSLVVICTI